VANLLQLMVVLQNNVTARTNNPAVFIWHKNQIRYIIITYE
jgi:hypothetical protein